jgi:hypothetical protein
MTCEVWFKGEYLGRIAITGWDWINANNWRQAALQAAARVFGKRRAYHVTEKSEPL